jgi:hypothetical protein
MRTGSCQIIRFQPFLRMLYIYCQNPILKMKSAEIMCFIKIFKSQNSIKSFIKITKFLQMVQVGLQKKLAKYSCGSLLLWL